MYRLDNRFARDRFNLAVVGCGGTGGFVAEGLCRLLPPRAALVLVNHDRVEEANLTRQNFTRVELGCFKAEALALRLARRYGRPVGYSVLPVAMAKREWPTLVIGCIDNGPARRDVARKFDASFGGRAWWVDAGNGENYGQVLIGNADKKHLEGAFNPEKELCYALPLPTIQRPDILAQPAPAPNCAQAVQAGGQSPTINQAMAALVLEVARRLIGGTCSWMQLYLDLEAGTLFHVMATPEAVQKLTRVAVRKQMLKKETNERR